VWGTPITGAAITYPTGGEVYLAGSPVICTMIRGGDVDCYWDTESESPGQEQDEMASNYPWWECDAGGWKNQIYIGESVVWLAPGACVSPIQISVCENDLPLPVPPGDEGDRDDTVFVTPPVVVHSVVPFMSSMEWKGNVEVADIPKPEITGSRNEAGVWPVTHKASVQVCINCQAIALPAAVRIEGLTGEDAWDIGGWHWVSTTWGPGYFPSLTTHEANTAIAPAVHERVYWSYWRYCCPEGTDQPIPLANPTTFCRLFALYDNPGTVLAYKKGVAAAVRWATGAMYLPNVAAGICQGVQGHITYDPSSGGGINDAIGTMLTMAPNYGEVTQQGGPYMCEDHAKLMKDLCGYHNIGASIRYLWGGTNSFWSKKFYEYQFPYDNPQQWVTLAVTHATSEDLCPPNPHFWWHAICRIGSDSYDPSFGAGYPNFYCWHPSGAIQDDDSLPSSESYWRDWNFDCRHRE